MRAAYRCIAPYGRCARLTAYDQGQEVGRIGGDVECRERLGGILRYYHRKAA